MSTRAWPSLPRAVAALLLIALPLLARSTASLPAATVVKTELESVRVVTLTEALQHPWGLAFLPDGRMLVTERPGRLRLVDRNGTPLPQPVTGLPPIQEHGQGGLLDVALHPRFAETRLVYLCYAGRGDGGVGTDVLRGRLEGPRLEGIEVLFRQTPKSSGGRHFGCRLVFDRAGYLYVTLGDRGEMERAQRMDDLAGKVVRLHEDGRVPRDNPFAGPSAGPPGTRPEIFTLGNRNVQGAALHPVTGELWTHEHGPQGGDEVNIIRAGVNYGWPVITYGVNYGIGTRIGEGTHKPGMAQPLHFWVPSIAPSGLAFYTGDRFPRWKGDLFVGALRDQLLVRLRLDGERVIREERLLQGLLGRIRDVRQGPDGHLYLLTDAPNGRIVRLEPAR